MSNIFMGELKQCPFCGSSGQVQDHRLVFSVSCVNPNCEAQVLGERSPELESEQQENETDWNALKQTAIDKWNNRVNQGVSND